MENLISKELLSEVLKVKIRKINSSILDGNLYYYKELVKCKSKINIYELAHKCKEWALTLMCGIESVNILMEKQVKQQLSLIILNIEMARYFMQIQNMKLYLRLVNGY